VWGNNKEKGRSEPRCSRGARPLELADGGAAVVLARARLEQREARRRVLLRLSRRLARRPEPPVLRRQVHHRPPVRRRLPLPSVCLVDLRRPAEPAPRPPPSAPAAPAAPARGSPGRQRHARARGRRRRRRVRGRGRGRGRRAPGQGGPGRGELREGVPASAARLLRDHLAVAREALGPLLDALQPQQPGDQRVLHPRLLSGRGAPAQRAARPGRGGSGGRASSSLLCCAAAGPRGIMSHRLQASRT
jgi:hypothetical protein